MLGLKLIYVSKKVVMAHKSAWWGSQRISNVDPWGFLFVTLNKLFQEQVSGDLQ